MRVLEAWFHPGGRSDRRAVLVARLICAPGRADVLLMGDVAGEVRPLDRAALGTKLRFLVENALPNVFDELRALKSAFWSFKEEGT